jgi:predicted transcriptional regulator of viral defense system
MPLRSLSMTDVLRRLPLPLFTAADAAKLVSNENVFLFRASRKGYIQKIANRIYWNVLFSPQPPSVEQVACFARRPSYISGEWALNYHGILLQVPTVCTAITLSSAIGRRNRIIYNEFIIEYSRIQERLYLPDQILNLDGVLMATAEKALIDTIYLRHRVPQRGELELDGLDPNRIRLLVTFFPPSVVRRIEKLDLQEG